MNIADDDCHLTVNINNISSELERTNLAYAPQVLQKLNEINDSEQEIGHVEGKRLKQCYIVGI